MRIALATLLLMPLVSTVGCARRPSQGDGARRIELAVQRAPAADAPKASALPKPAGADSTPRVEPADPPARTAINKAAREAWYGGRMKDKVVKTDAEWRELLTPTQFRVLREKGTERAFTGAYWDAHERAVYVCAACGHELFDSDTKYDSGSGWPSFTAPIAAQAVATEEDVSLGMARTEVTCARCGGHLGHVFPDGPRPTGQRYCINSASIDQRRKPVAEE